MMFEALQPYLVEAATGLIVAVSAWLAAWLRADTQRRAAIAAAEAVEDETANGEVPVPGHVKRARAAVKMGAALPWHAKPSPKRAGRLIDAAVPVIKKLRSERPPRKS